ncbi:MAG: hypothetical protein HC919_12370 [Oscillatoriales cyanobacterium SM2_2_1]|nr:hypothetical protein [Oscillatoriales cyanobacterium SM2_2_1]
MMNTAALLTVHLKAGLQKPPLNASEATVRDLFARPLLNSVGFLDVKIHPEFNTGNDTAIQAARKSHGDDIFCALKPIRCY